MALYRVIETIHYEVTADSPEEAEAIIVNAEDRDKTYFHHVEDRTTVNLNTGEGQTTAKTFNEYLTAP